MPRCLGGLAHLARLLFVVPASFALACGPTTTTTAETTPAPRGAPTEDVARDSAADPRGDPDMDGIVNAADACPCDAEDVDGFADDDGCPDVDNDDDGVHDACDQCPFLPETYQNEGEPDGCPDTGRVAIAVEPVRILELIRFRPRSAAISANHSVALDSAAATLRDNPEVQVSVHGHADRSEPQRQALSARRAQAVYDALVERGIAAERLSVRSHGSDEPYQPGRSAAAQRANRRVEFEVEHAELPPMEPQATMPRARPEGCQPPAPSAC